MYLAGNRCEPAVNVGRGLPLRREQTRALIALVVLLAIGTLVLSALSVVSDPDFAEQLHVAELRRDDGTWLVHSLGHGLGVRVTFTHYQDGPAGLEIGALRGQPHYIILFRDDATAVDVSWPPGSPGIVAVVPESLRERFTPPSPDDNPPDDDRPDVLHLPFPQALDRVADGESRKRAALIVLALQLKDRVPALDEFGFALRRYAVLAKAVVDTLDRTADMAAAPLPAELAAIRREADDLHGSMLAQADEMTALMRTVLDTGQSASNRAAAEAQYNRRIGQANNWIVEASDLVGRFQVVGRRYQVPVENVLNADRDILETLVRIELAPNTGLRHWAQGLLLLLLLAMAGMLVALVVASRMHFPAAVRREMRGFGIRDNALQRTLLEKHRERWLQVRDIRDVLVAMRHDCREWVKQHRQQTLFGFETLRTVGPEYAEADAASDVVETGDDPEHEDKRQQRARKRREGKDAAARAEAAAIAEAESAHALLVRVLKAADFDLYDLENVPAARQQELARFIPEARRMAPRRLWRRWCREFVGSDDATWMPLLERARKNDWSGMREVLERTPTDDAAPTTAPATDSGTSPLASAEEPGQPFEGQSVAVIGGNPWMRAFYLRAVQQLGARRARWYDGTHDVSRLDRLGADIVIFLFKGLSHGTSRRVTARQVPGRQARLLFSEHPGRSRFVASVLEAIELSAQPA